MFKNFPESDNRSRMSDTDNTDTDNTSFLQNLKNTVRYKAHKKIYSPDANTFAKKQEEIEKKKKEEDEGQKEKKRKEEEEKNATETNNTSTTSLIFKHSILQIKSLAAKIIIPFISIIIAMFVVNDMIIYPRPVRIIMFIIVGLLCSFLPFYMGMFIVYYGFKMMYAWYKHNLSERIFKDGKEVDVKHRYMPKIFALLPITTSEPCSSFGRFFYYIFRYPKYDSEDYDKGGALKGIMDDYLSSLKDSFTDFNKYKSNPLFGKLLGRVEDNFNIMHKKDVKDCGTAKPITSTVPQSSEPIKPVAAPVAAPVESVAGQVSEDK